MGGRRGEEEGMVEGVNDSLRRSNDGLEGGRRREGGGDEERENKRVG